MDVDLYRWLTFIVLIAFSIVFSQLVYSLIRRIGDSRLGRHRSKVSANVIKYIIFAILVIWGLTSIIQLDIQTSLISLGILGIIIGLATQNLFQDMIAGIQIIMERTIRVDEWVEIGGWPLTPLCRVNDIKLMRTTFRDINGRVIMAPNSLVNDSKLINYSRSGVVRVEAPFDVPRSCDLVTVDSLVKLVGSQMAEVLDRSLERDRLLIDKVLEMPHFDWLKGAKRPYEHFEPSLRVLSMREEVVEVRAVIWITDVEQSESVISEFLSRIKVEMERVGICFRAPIDL